jgi:hypothetical protein
MPISPIPRAELDFGRRSAGRHVRFVAVARVDVQNDSGLESREFEAFARPIETRAGAPWILEDKKTICEVKNGKAEYHPASEDELRDGKEYPGGLAEYLAARVA